MDRLQQAFEHERSGRFVLALDDLEHASIPGDRKIDAQVLKAGVLERLGRHSQGRAVAMSVLSSRNATARARARCECILGRIEREKGAIDLAIERFQKAALLADEIADLESLCWAHCSCPPTTRRLAFLLDKGHAAPTRMRGRLPSRCRSSYRSSRIHDRRDSRPRSSST